MIKILEIDDNNNSNVFQHSEEVDGESVKVKNGDNALTDLIFDYFENQIQMVVDAGGGNDSIATVKLIKDSGVPFTYIIPVGNSLAQLENAKATYDLIGDPQNTIFAINRVHDIDDVEKEFTFWFGDDDLGIESFAKTIDSIKTKTVLIEHSSLFELSAVNGITINELAQFSHGLDKTQAMELFCKETQGNREQFKKMVAQWKQSIAAVAYLEKTLKQFKKIKTQKNIAVVSTKGGVGKSTIAWHLAKLILEIQKA